MPASPPRKRTCRSIAFPRSLASAKRTRDQSTTRSTPSGAASGYLSTRSPRTHTHWFQYDDWMTQGCRKCWLVHAINMSKSWRSVLRRVRGEEHLLLRQYFRAASASILPFVLTLFLYSPRYPVAAFQPTSIRSYQEDPTLSQRTVGMPEFNELIDMARLLVNLWEAAQRLPEGSERREAFRQISGFQRRVAALVTRAI
jgi:hypothetical protein